jgi:hypothetical protein
LVLACFTISFHNLLSLHFSLQFRTFVFFKSSSTCLFVCFHGRPRQVTGVLQPAGLLYRSSTWFNHLSLGLPTGLDEHGSHSVGFLTVSCTYQAGYITLCIGPSKPRRLLHLDYHLH